MKTLTVDDHKRIRIPDAKPRQVFAYEKDSSGRLNTHSGRAGQTIAGKAGEKERKNLPG
jgi:hypothetical protein